MPVHNIYALPDLALSPSREMNGMIQEMNVGLESSGAPPRSKRTKKPVVGGGYKSEMRKARMNSRRSRSNGYGPDRSRDGSTNCS